MRMIPTEKWRAARAANAEHEDALQARADVLADVCALHAEPGREWWSDRIDIQNGVAEVYDPTGTYRSGDGLPCRRERLNRAERAVVRRAQNAVVCTLRAAVEIVADVAAEAGVPATWVDIVTGQITPPPRPAAQPPRLPQPAALPGIAPAARVRASARPG